MILQNFELIKDESYKLKYQVTMTVRPIGFFMKVRLRTQWTKSYGSRQKSFGGPLSPYIDKTGPALAINT